MVKNSNEGKQTLLSVGVFLLALGMATGAWFIPSEAGYSGIGPDFLPWLVSCVLLICALFLLYEARTGGFRDMEESEGAEPPYWLGFAWMSGGLLINAALITSLGFVLSCTVCFVMATRGMRLSQGKPGGGMRTWVADTVVGVLIATPVYWMFTKFLAINLPGLTQTGWL